jgi:DNA mismatch repair protein MutS2
MDSHTLKILEFDKIKQRLSGLCQSPLGQAEIDRLYPATDHAIIQKRLNQIQEMKEIFLYQGGFPALAVADLRQALEKVKPEGTSWEAAEFLSLANLLTCVRGVLKFAKEQKGKFSLIEEIIRDLKFPEKLLESINKSIEANGEMKDSASPQLARIRREKINLRQEVVSKLHSILRSAKVSPEEEIVTLRQGRFVISLPESDLARVKGIIQDRSSTGLTYFIEPVAIVEFNNKLKALELEEVREIHRILMDLGRMVREHLPELLKDIEVIAELDSLAAKARFSIEYKCNAAVPIQEKFIRLIKARHPFLNQEAVVPLTLELGRGFTTLVITGPNTGGKTVALKTVGLLSLMLQSGLQIPAETDSSIGIFDRIFADIGDEQSIEMSLSTFSSHIGQIIRAVEQADQNSLILLDEIGAGTDPQEGAALGEAILSYLTEKGTRTIVTTHLGALKVLAQNIEKIGNGSFEFDQKSLKPTYQFRMGIPGSSYAVEIASRLGLKPDITRHAVSLIGTQEKDLTALLEVLDRELKQIREERAVLSQKKEETEKVLSLYTAKLQRAEKEQKEIKGKALTEARDLLSKSRVQIEHLIKELRETKAEKQSIKKALAYIEEKSKEIKEEEEKYKPEKLDKLEKIEIGQRVWVETLKTEGEVASLPDRGGKVKVLAGGVSLTVSKNDLYEVKTESRTKAGITKLISETEAVSPELSVRGMTSDEAIEKVDKYLDQVLLAGLNEVYIIHGKGTGTLRRKIAEFLKSHPRVEESHLAEWDQGGAGVTVVKLRSG